MESCFIIYCDFAQYHIDQTTTGQKAQNVVQEKNHDEYSSLQR